MALKTFNLDGGVYKKYSSWCRKNGISMSRRVENFLRNEVENLKIPDKKSENLRKLEKTESSVHELKHEISDGKEKKEEHPLSKYC
jgi:hypothetical protein